MSEPDGKWPEVLVEGVVQQLFIGVEIVGVIRRFRRVLAAYPVEFVLDDFNGPAVDLVVRVRANGG